MLSAAEHLPAISAAADGRDIDDDSTKRLDGFDHQFAAYFAQRGEEVAALARQGELALSDAYYVGSPSYMAPEQWVAPQVAASACDVYALGVLAFECLCGRRPFIANDILGVARAHLVQALPELPPDLPPGLHAVLAKAAAKRVADRQPDAMSLWTEIEAACAIGTPTALPPLPADLVATVLARAPQPIAEALGAAESARGVDEAWRRTIALVELVCQYSGVLGLAAYARLGEREPGEELVEAIHACASAVVTPANWLALATEATRGFVRLRDAFPVPELVDLCHRRDDGGRITADALRTLWERATSVDVGRADARELAALIDEAARSLRECAELFEYDLAVTSGDRWERWIGQRRHPRLPVDVAAELPEGAPVLLDRNGAALLSLWPVMKAMAPTPGADSELFLLAGAGRYGARLTAQPKGFERQDPEVAEWLVALAGTTASEHGDDRDERAPYRGLASFSAGDSDLFFGRERESEQLANHLRARSFAAVVGPSGAGKSSFVQAGVVPLLPPSWRPVVLRPGANPMATLRERLLPFAPEPALVAAAMAARGETLVIVIDQSEELVTLCRDDDSQHAFAQFLAGVRDDARVRVVLTLRDDFLMRMQRLPGLGERLTNGIHLLGTPSRADLRRILTEPARHMSYAFEDGELVEEMVGAVADNASALALLSFTAARMWELRDRQFKKLRRKVYASIGGVGGALAQHAEEVIVQMAPEERELVREAFRMLVTADGTRAVIAHADLAQSIGGGAPAARVIEQLVQARLLVSTDAPGVPGGVTVEVTHEALLVSWPRLVGWRRDDAETSRLREQLRASAQQWDARGRPHGLLWRGDVLAEFKLWRGRFRGRLTDLEHKFCEAFLRDDVRRVRRARVLLAGAFTVLAGASIVLYLFAARARASAHQATETTIASLGEQGRLELLNERPLHAIRSLAGAYELGGRDPALRFLLARAMAAFDGQGPVLRGHTAEVRHVAFVGDGTRVLSHSDDGTLRLWDATTGAQITSVSVRGPARAAWTRDINRVALAGIGEATLRDPGDLHVLARWKLGGAAPRSIALCDGGTRAIVGDDAGTVSILDVGREPRTLAVHKGPVAAAACAGDAWATGGNDGRVILGHDDQARELVRRRSPVYVVTIDAGKLAAGYEAGMIDVWTTARGEQVTTYAAQLQPVEALAFAPGGSVLASATGDGMVRLWHGPGEVPRALAGHRGFVFSVAFDRAGRQLLSTGGDGTARVWDATTGAPIATFDAHQAEAWSAAFDAAGARIVTSSFDHTARLWSIPRTARRLATAGPGVGFETVEIASTGARIVAGGTDGQARVYARDGVLVAELATGPESVEALAISPDGAHVVTGLGSGVTRLWDVARRAVTAELETARGGAFVARYRPDGRALIVAGGDGVIRVFDPRTGALVQRLTGHVGPLWGASYSRDGSLLATCSDDGTLRLWDGATGAPLRAMGPFGTRLTAVAFDPGARRVAVVSKDGKLRVFDVSTGLLVGERVAHEHMAVAVTFSGDGAFLVSASLDMSIIVWDAATLRELARVPRHTQPPTAVGFLPGTTELLSGGLDGALWLSDLSLETRTPETVERLLSERPVD
jgi:WD40 repeat protein